MHYHRIVGLLGRVALRLIALHINHCTVKHFFRIRHSTSMHSANLKTINSSEGSPFRNVGRKDGISRLKAEGLFKSCRQTSNSSRQLATFQNFLRMTPVLKAHIFSSMVYRDEMKEGE